MIRARERSRASYRLSLTRARPVWALSGRPSRLLDPRHHLRGQDVEGLANAHEYVDAGVLAAALDHVDVGPVELGLVGQRLLRKPGFLSHRADFISDTHFGFIGPHVGSS